MTWIKICGTTNLEDARLAVDAGADALGFVFAESPRRVTPEQAREIIAELPAEVETVGVFVNEPAERIREISEQVVLTSVQLHGGKEPGEAERLAAWAVKWPLRRIIFVMSGLLSHPEQPNGELGFLLSPSLGGETGPRTALLVDAGTRERLGGTGSTFDWTQWAPFFRDEKLLDTIVAGGLNPQNVGEAVNLLRPWGVDVVSGVEREPGKKDPRKVRSFVNAVRQADKEHAKL